jgi:microsomal dipeptidase-like Zn-dependent dipeptidase
MIADLHVHYPMRVVEDLTPATTGDQLGRLAQRLSLGERLQAVLLHALGRAFSDRDPRAGYRVTVEGLRAGGVGVVLSALYRPLQEMDLSKPYGAPPDAGYFPALLRDLERVEAEVAGHGDRDLIRVAHDAGELDAAHAAGAIAIVHCVEGGFHLGDTPAHVAANVAELAARGVAYVTVAHLFFRGVAANAPALPFLDDADYDVAFPQPPGIGLTALGEAAVRAMLAHGVLIDLSHMRADAIAATLDLMDAVDPGRGVPVLATHAGFRFGSQHYMLDEPVLERIRDRDGVVGLILAQHQLNDGLRDAPTTTFAQTKDIIFRHVDRIAQITGGYDHLAIGSDLDGFIKPTATGLESSADLARLDPVLRERYGDEDAEKILSGNVLRVLRAGWGTR